MNADSKQLNGFYKSDPKISHRYLCSPFITRVVAIVPSMHAVLMEEDGLMEDAMHAVLYLQKKLIGCNYCGDTICHAFICI